MGIPSKTFLSIIDHKPTEHIDENIEVPLIFGPTIGRCIPFKAYKALVIGSFTIPINAQLSIEDYIPKVSPLCGENFYGVDRRVDSIRFLGVRYATDDPLDEAISNMEALLAREGAKPNYFLLSPFNYKILEMMYDRKTVYENGGIKIFGNYGNMTALEDTTIDDFTVFMIDSSTWNYDKVLTCNMPGWNGRIIFPNPLSYEK